MQTQVLSDDAIGELVPDDHDDFGGSAPKGATRPPKATPAPAARPKPTLHRPAVQVPRIVQPDGVLPDLEQDPDLKAARERFDSLYASWRATADTLVDMAHELGVDPNAASQTHLDNLASQLLAAGGDVEKVDEYERAVRAEKRFFEAMKLAAPPVAAAHQAAIRKYYDAIQALFIPGKRKIGLLWIELMKAQAEQTALKNRAEAAGHAVGNWWFGVPAYGRMGGCEYVRRLVDEGVLTPEEAAGAGAPPDLRPPQSAVAAALRARDEEYMRLKVHAADRQAAANEE